jgi:hypothetical protein
MRPLEPSKVTRSSASPEVTRSSARPNEPQIKPDWKDFFALVIAAYSLLLPPLLLILGAGLLVVLFLSVVFR